MVDREEVTQRLIEIQYSMMGAEILFEAFMAIKENPELTIMEALDLGAAEWEK